jgi:hypothetical protein
LASDALKSRKNNNVPYVRIARLASNSGAIRNFPQGICIKARLLKEIKKILENVQWSEQRMSTETKSATASSESQPTACPICLYALD